MSDSTGLPCRAGSIGARVIELGAYVLVAFLLVDKGEAFRSFGLYAPPAALLLIFALKRKITVNFRRHLLVILALLASSALVSSLIAEDPAASLDVFRKSYVKALLIYVTFIAAFTDRDRLGRMLRFCAVMALVFTLLAFYAFFARALTPDGAVLIDHLRKYSVGLAFFLPFVPFAALSSGSIRGKALWGVVMAAGISALMLTGFRGGWMSVAASLGLWSLLYLPARGAKPVLGALVLSVTAVVVVLAVLPTSYVKTRLKLGFDLHGRAENWQGYGEIFASADPLRAALGHGLENSVMLDAFEAWKTWGDDVPPKVKSRDWYNNPHNSYIYYRFRQGLVGAGLYALLMLAFLVLVFRRVLAVPGFADKAMGVAIAAPLLGEFVVRGMVEDPRLLPVAVLVGLADSYLYVTSARV